MKQNRVCDLEPSRKSCFRPTWQESFGEVAGLKLTRGGDHLFVPVKDLYIAWETQGSVSHQVCRFRLDAFLLSWRYHLALRRSSANIPSDALLTSMQMKTKAVVLPLTSVSLGELALIMPSAGHKSFVSPYPETETRLACHIFAISLCCWHGSTYNFTL